MEIRIIQEEDTSEWDTGGGYQVNQVDIFVDKTLPLIKQQKIVIYELLIAYLDPLEYQGGKWDDLAQAITEGINQLK